VTDYVRQYDLLQEFYRRLEENPFEAIPWREKQGLWGHVITEVENLVEKFESDATVTDGVVRWNSNDSVPPLDILKLWQHVGKPFDFAKSDATRAAETAAFLAEYRRLNTGRKRSAEEMFELRAGFGEGAKVVDVVTGDPVRT
jgi:hypothetical protein